MKKKSYQYLGSKTNRPHSSNQFLTKKQSFCTISFQERCLQSAMFEIPGSDIERVILTVDVVKNKAEPIFIREKQSELDVDILNADTEVANITSVTNTNTTPKLLKNMSRCVSTTVYI